MATSLELSATVRSETGRHVHAVRRRGDVPAVLYGHNVEPQALSIEARSLRRVWHQAGHSHLVDLALEGARVRKVLIRELQVSPRTTELMHVDLFAVNLREKLTVEIPLIPIGESPAVTGSSSVSRADHHLRQGGVHARRHPGAAQRRHLRPRPKIDQGVRSRRGAAARARHAGDRCRRGRARPQGCPGPRPPSRLRRPRSPQRARPRRPPRVAAKTTTPGRPPSGSNSGSRRRCLSTLMGGGGDRRSLDLQRRATGSTSSAPPSSLMGLRGPVGPLCRRRPISALTIFLIGLCDRAAGPRVVVLWTMRRGKADRQVQDAGAQPDHRSPRTSWRLVSGPCGPRV